MGTARLFSIEKTRRKQFVDTVGLVAGAPIGKAGLQRRSLR
jgi:hypothetical protein